MADNTNNSLSDLNKDGKRHFNRLLKDDEIRGRQKSKSDNDVLSAENTALTSKVQSSKDNSVKDELTNKINTNNSTIQKNNSITVDKDGNQTNNATFDLALKTGNNPASLFDRDAMIDYGRYINTDGSVKSEWKEYLSEVNEQGDISFKLNSNIKKINEPVFFKDSSLFDSNSDFSNEGLSIDNLISWSEKYPALQLRYQDFVYCKKLGYYPNNRLIILRRFKGGVPDNIFDYYRKDSSKLQYTQPLSTMITWLNPEDDIIDMTFNEGWVDYNKGFIETIKQNILGKTEDNKSPNLKDTFEDMLTSLVIEGSGKITDTTKREDGVPFSRSSIGNPNLIRQAKKKESLKSTLTFDLTFEYELRFINKVDPSIAILDLMSNAMRMGTSESEFRYNMPLFKDAPIVNSLINGDISKFTELFSENIKKFTDAIAEKVVGVIDLVQNSTTSNVVDAGKSVISEGVKYIVSRYREDLKASLAVDTGLPSGVWHVTIGNPKAPIISCGDLIISMSTLTLGKELGYNDFPNSFKVNYKLDSARPRGRNELIRIFNSGRGRLYVYPTAKDNPDYDLY